MKKTLLFLLLAALLGFGVLTLTAASPDWLPYELRRAAEAPVLNAETVLSGKAVQDAEKWMADHIFRRQSLMRLKARLELLRAKAAVNGVVSTETVLLPEPDGKTPADTADELARRLRNIQDTVTAYGGTFLYVHVPEQRSALRSAYPDWMHTDNDAIDADAAALLHALGQNGVAYLDMTDLLDETDYFRTDHHYNIYGADKTASAICKAVGVDYQSPAITPTQTPFLGTYGRKLFGVSPVGETLLLPELTVPYTRFDNGEPSDTPTVDLPEGAEYVEYAVFMGGDIGETVLKTDRPELPDLLLVGDSFTNPLEALLYGCFDETRSIDFRHYAEKTLTEYLRAYKPEAVIVVRNDVGCLDLTGNGELS